MAWDEFTQSDSAAWQAGQNEKALETLERKVKVLERKLQAIEDVVYAVNKAEAERRADG